MTINLYGITLTKPTDKGLTYYTRFKFAKNASNLKIGVLKKLEGSKWELKNIYYVRPADSFESWHTKNKLKNY